MPTSPVRNNRALLTTAPPAPVEAGPISNPKARAQARKDRFAKLVELRALYRDFMRAKTLLRLESPVYTPSEEPPVLEDTPEGQCSDT